jgi:hypothetical protein
MRMTPSVGSYNLGMRYVIVVLPAPEGPTNAIKLPGRAIKETPS